jgi:hypothetical protein
MATFMLYCFEMIFQNLKLERDIKMAKDLKSQKTIKIITIVLNIFLNFFSIGTKVFTIQSKSPIIIKVIKT